MPFADDKSSAFLREPFKPTDGIFRNRRYSLPSVVIFNGAPADATPDVPFRSLFMKTFSGKSTSGEEEPITFYSLKTAFPPGNFAQFTR